MELFQKLYGKPVLGKSGSLAFDGTNKTTPALEGGCLYMLTATADCFIAVGGVATTAANQTFIPQGVPVVFALGSVGSAPVVNVTQVSVAGTLYWSKLDKVG